MRTRRRRKYWNLLREITIAQYRTKDQHTFFGFAWGFLHPLLLLGVLYFFFRTWAGQGIEHYGIYLLIALVHFTHFSNSTSAGMMVLYNSRALTCNTVLPKEVLVLGTVLSKIPEFAISMAICVVIACATGVPPRWALIYLPVIVALQILLVLWVSLLLAAAYVFVKDIEHVYQVFLRLLFLVTPTFYAPHFLGQSLARYVVELNPLAQLIGYSRAVIIADAPVPFALVGILLLVNALLVAGAFVVFKRLEPQFAENV
jgi:ABC-type polysaccharide/polyol phosphate export permease